jgi:hypothetical protein
MVMASSLFTHVGNWEIYQTKPYTKNYQFVEIISKGDLLKHYREALIDAG